MNATLCPSTAFPRPFTAFALERRLLPFHCLSLTFHWLCLRTPPLHSTAFPRPPADGPFVPSSVRSFTSSVRPTACRSVLENVCRCRRAGYSPCRKCRRPSMVMAPLISCRRAGWGGGRRRGGGCGAAAAGAGGDVFGERQPGLARPGAGGARTQKAFFRHSPRVIRGHGGPTGGPTMVAPHHGG